MTGCPIARTRKVNDLSTGPECSSEIYGPSTFDSYNVHNVLAEITLSDIYPDLLEDRQFSYSDTSNNTQHLGGEGYSLASIRMALPSYSKLC